MIVPAGKVLGIVLAAGWFIGAAPAIPAQLATPRLPELARVGALAGDVAIVRGDDARYGAASIGATLLPGDSISTANGSQTEIRFEDGSTLQLSQETQVRLVRLDPRSCEVQLVDGSAELAELPGPGATQQIDTPSATIRPNRSGDYRVSVLPNGQTLVGVRSGSATVVSGGGTQTLTPDSRELIVL
ncbi:MAG: FecR family protein [Candidatus Tumulicola sp.]